MAALQCDICGGRLIGKPGGILECDSCGMEYSTEWAKAKIQEIKGTVKVEGTVQVAGTVKVDGPVELKGGVNIESLIKRGQNALEDEKWEDASKFFDDALNLDAERADAHWGLLCAKFEQPNISCLLKEKYEIIRENKDYQRALNLSDNKIKGWAASREMKFQAAKSEARIKSAGKALELEAVRKRIRPARQLILKIDNMIFGVMTDGSVRMAGTPSVFQKKIFDEVGQWKEICAIFPGPCWKSVVGLKFDGTVVLANPNGFDEDHKKAVSAWKDIAAIGYSWNNVIGLKKDGTVVLSGNDYFYYGTSVSEWKNIVAVHADENHIYGVKSDGRVVVATSEYDEKTPVTSWKDIVGLGGHGILLYGLKADGTVVTIDPEFRKAWTDVVDFFYDGIETCGLRSDGTVVSEYGSHDDLQNVAAICRRLVLKNDGTVLYRGPLTETKFDGTVVNLKLGAVHTWKLFNHIDTLEQEQVEAREWASRERERRAEEARRADEEARKRREEKIAALEAEKNQLSADLSALKGLFTGKRRREITARMSEIETELKGQN